MKSIVTLNKKRRACYTMLIQTKFNRTYEISLQSFAAFDLFVRTRTLISETLTHIYKHKYVIDARMQTYALYDIIFYCL